MKQKAALMGYDDIGAQTAKVEAAQQLARHRGELSLRFDAPSSEPPHAGQPYRTTAGKALLTAYEQKGNPTHDVRVSFQGAPQQATVVVIGHLRACALSPTRPT